MNDVPDILLGPEPPEDLGELAALINDDHRGCEEAMKSGLEHAYRAGYHLIYAKSLVPHGEWTSWIGENFEGSMRSAQMYMKVYRNREKIEGLKTHRGAFSLRAARRELSEPRRPEESPLEGVRRALAPFQEPEEPEHSEAPAREPREPERSDAGTTEAFGEDSRTSMLERRQAAKEPEPTRAEKGWKNFNAFMARLHELAAGVDMAGGLAQILRHQPEQNRRIFAKSYRALAERALRQVEDFDSERGS